MRRHRQMVMAPGRAIRQINNHRDYVRQERPSLVTPAKAGWVLQIFRLVARFRNRDVEILFGRDRERDRGQSFLRFVGGYFGAGRIGNNRDLVLGTLEQRGARSTNQAANRKNIDRKFLHNPP